MKKVIGGKLYNCETAEVIGSWDNGLSVRDFEYEAETLFRNKNGVYFLLCEGGAKSTYAEQEGNTSSNGWLIRPYTEQEARRWAMKRLRYEVYAAIFGEVTEA